MEARAPAAKFTPLGVKIDGRKALQTQKLEVLVHPVCENRRTKHSAARQQCRCHRQAVARHLAATRSVPAPTGRNRHGTDRTRHGTGRRATPPTTRAAGVVLPSRPPLRHPPGTAVQASLRRRGVTRYPKSVDATDGAAAEVAAAGMRGSTAAARQAAEVRVRFLPRKLQSSRTGFRVQT